MKKIRKPDLGHRLTDEELSVLEDCIADEYKKAAEELQEKIDNYFKRLKKRDAEQKALIGTIINGREYTEQDYKQWRLAQIGRGKRFEALRDRVAERMTDANTVAAAYINDKTPGIYSLNRNYSAYTIEQQVGTDVGFDLWDEQTVKRLIVERPDLMPYYPPKRAVKRGIDLKWGKQQITAQVTSGILQGESIKHLADRLQQKIPEMNRTSAIRAARTAVTGAQNAGRIDSYAAAEEMGIKLKKQWLATLDNRTRHAHRLLDGQIQPNDKPFHSELGDIMFPGDPAADPANVYNCRCTMIADVEDAPKSPNPLRRAQDPETGESIMIPDMTYAQWESWKKSENRYVWETYQKKGRNYSADQKQFAEYQAVLGKNAPGTFAEFQNLKYNSPDRWELLKTEKRQTVFVNGAPCVTTPKKYTGYFLKPGAKHAEEFFNVGYTQGNPMQLRYDMARQFDMSKAVSFSTDEDGKERFRIYMDLGVETKKRFRTAWIKDSPEDKPRIVTAFREDRSDD